MAHLGEMELSWTSNERAERGGLFHNNLLAAGHRARCIRSEFSREPDHKGSMPFDALGLSDLVVLVSRCRDSKISEILSTQLKRENLASRLSATSQAFTARSEPCAMTPRRRLFSF